MGALENEGGHLTLTSQPQELASVQDHGWGGWRAGQGQERDRWSQRNWAEGLCLGSLASTHVLAVRPLGTLTCAHHLRRHLGHSLSVRGMWR